MKNALKDFGPVYVINLKSREDRLSHIKKEFNKHNVKDYTIIEAVDGSNEDLSLLVDNINSIPLSKNEIACSISHLKAIKHWLDTSTSEYGIIIEDDLTFETVDNWQWNWKEFLSKIDTYYDILQLSIINTYKVNTSLHYREIRDSSAACYVIKRSWAEKLIAKHVSQDKFIFNGKDKPRLVADGLVYNGAVCLSFPLFTYSVELGSSINQNHINSIHLKSRNEILEYWKTKPKSLQTKPISLQTKPKEKKKLCIILTATNYYFPLGVRFMNRWAHLYNGDYDVEFHFYSEKDPTEYINVDKINVIYKYMSSNNWSEADLSRITEIAKLEDHNFDYVYIFDADTNINSEFNDLSFIGDLVGFEHIFEAKLFDSNKESGAWIPASFKDMWYQTCLIGGSKKEMVDMCKAALPWIEQDKAINYVPKFIAEKYFNKYLFYKKPSRSLKQSTVPFIMSDKGSSSNFTMGIDQRPFFDLSDNQYEDILKKIKENKEKFWNIKNFEFIIESR